MTVAKDIEIQIMQWQVRGCSQDDTYIYFKDYATQQDVAGIFSRGNDDLDDVRSYYAC